MANENVSRELLADFEAALIAHGAKSSCVQPTNGHSFALGYIFSMLQAGNFNETVLKQRMQDFIRHSTPFLTAQGE
jgi:hypothetical protein